MNTTYFTADEKLGLLLHVLGGKAVDKGLAAIPEARAEAVRRFIGELRQDPPTRDEIDFVLEDFEKYFRFALKSLGVDSDGKIRKGDSSARKMTGPQIINFKPVDGGNEPASDLVKLDAWQVASALASDRPKTVSLVLSQLPTTYAAAVLELLPEELRMSSFIQMRLAEKVPEQILRPILQATFDKANKIRQRRNEVDHIDRIVEMMRGLTKTVRQQLISELILKDEDFANLVREKMYRFEDLGRLDDRSIQAVLARVSSQQLVMSLTNAEPRIAARILNNMSKRARATVEEEISFNEQADEREIEAARKEIAQIVGRMDESGEISI